MKIINEHHDWQTICEYLDHLPEPVRTNLRTDEPENWCRTYLDQPSGPKCLLGHCYLAHPSGEKMELDRYAARYREVSDAFDRLAHPSRLGLVVLLQRIDEYLRYQPALRILHAPADQQRALTEQFMTWLVETRLDRWERRRQRNGLAGSDISEEQARGWREEAERGERKALEAYVARTDSFTAERVCRLFYLPAPNPT